MPKFETIAGIPLGLSVGTGILTNNPAAAVFVFGGSLILVSVLTLLN